MGFVVSWTFFVHGATQFIAMNKQDRETAKQDSESIQGFHSLTEHDRLVAIQCIRDILEGGNFSWGF